MQAHERGTDEPALKRQARRERLGDDGFGGRSFRAVGAMALGVKYFFRRGAERGDADAARGIAAGILETANLLGQFGLAGTRRGVVQRKNMIQDAGDDLQPFAFGAAEFFHFQPQRALLGVVELELKFIELADLRGHAPGDFAGGGDGFFRMAPGGFLNKRPLVGGGGDLCGIFFKILQLFGDSADGIDLDQFSRGAIIQNEWQAAKQRTERDGADAT